MIKTFDKSILRILISYGFLFLFLSSCVSKPNLKDFDISKLKRQYNFDINYTKEKFDELKQNDSLYDALSNFTMLGMLTFKADILFDKSSGGFFSSENRYNSDNFSTSLFKYKIENDSIIYLKVDDLDDTTEDKFIKSAILIEYEKNYKYFVIKPITGIYKDFEFKAVKEK